MKHYSASAFVSGPPKPTGAGGLLRLVTPPSIGEADLVAQLRTRLVAAEDRHALARELGVSPFKLAGTLRGSGPIDDDLAARLGYRRITRFEKIS